MKNKTCKKCQRPLPDGYKYNKCDSCRIKQAQRIKDGLKATVGVAGTIASFALVVVTKGKINPKK